MDDDGQALARAELPFTALPPRPDDWSAAGPTEFGLLPREAEFLHRQFANLCPSDAPGQKSLLAKVSAAPRTQADACRSSGIAEIAGDDGARLRRARHAASPAAVGRAVYTSLIEPLSLDEAYLDVTENLRAIPTASATATENRARIFAETGLTASAGISYNKFLAKLAPLHQLDAIFTIFGASDSDKRLILQGRGLRKPLVVPTKLLARPRAARESASCFCAPRFATRTARLIGHGRLWRTGAFMMVAWFSGKCCILER
jgi:hypothetical protein